MDEIHQDFELIIHLFCQKSIMKGFIQEGDKCEGSRALSLLTCGVLCKLPLLEGIKLW